ncbi:MAG: hypothetical protein KDJ90_15605 [Nitratireductor sp.]|nr:hypothetical protein [Nitratireductor sp.]
MRSFGNLIVRMVPIALGLAFAFLAAGLFFGFGFYSNYLDPAFEVDPGLRHDGFVVFVTGLIWSPFLAGAALGPALVLIAIAEWQHLRGLVSNVVLGGLAALLAFWIHFDFDPRYGFSDGALVVVLAAGFIGGFCYWLVAGRNAGKWLENPRPV